MKMFDKKKRGSKPDGVTSSEVTTLIGEECLFEGNITTSASTRIDGKLKGNFTGQSSLIIGENGVVIGEVRSDESTVYGKVEGIVESSRLEIKRGGHVSGDIFVQTLTIEDGGVLNGRCTMENSVADNIANFESASDKSIDDIGQEEINS